MIVEEDIDDDSSDEEKKPKPKKPVPLKRPAQIVRTVKESSSKTGESAIDDEWLKEVDVDNEDFF